METFKSPRNLPLEHTDKKKDVLFFFNEVKSQKEVISVVGASAIKEGSFEYDRVVDLVGRISNEKTAIITGGGPGLMEAANKGAKRTGSLSIGLDLRSEWEPHPQDFLTHYVRVGSLPFRKRVFLESSSTIIFAYGGLGTLGELFYFVDEMYANQIARKKIILFGPKWRSFEENLRELFVSDLETMRESHLNFWTIADTIEDVIKLMDENN